MKLFHLASLPFSGSLTGESSMDVKGRWHNVDLRCLYTCGSKSRCIVESGFLVEEGFPDLVFTIYEVPDNSLLEFTEDELPADWNAWPSNASTRTFGSRQLNEMKALVLSYPSAVFPEERIYVINTRHPLMDSVKVIGIEQVEKMVMEDI